MTLIKLDDDRDDDVLHDPTCNCVDCVRRDAAEEAEELEALGDEPPLWWVPDSLDEGGWNSLDSNPCPPVPECDWCGGKGCDICSDPNYAGVDP